nr:MAG TPA: hypothetical protein [Caudoviricetes sp.]
MRQCWYDRISGVYVFGCILASSKRGFSRVEPISPIP